MMKLLFTLLATTSLFNQDIYLVKQGGAEVTLGELDAYVYLLSERQRAEFSTKNDQIEKNIFTLLNVNIVYQYIINSNLNDQEMFKSIAENLQPNDVDPEDHFLVDVGVAQENMTESLNLYMLKIAYYRAMLKYVDQSLNEKAMSSLIKEHYLINKSDFIRPEKRDLSVIKLDQAAKDKVDSAKIINDLQNGSLEMFHKTALELSTDLSKDLNEGNWGEFRRSDFNHIFADEVFNSSVGIGVIPKLLIQGNDYFIVRINEIQSEKQLTYDEVKQDIHSQIKGKAAVRKFQGIINTQGQYKLDVNPEATAHIFERYKVFIEE